MKCSISLDEKTTKALTKKVMLILVSVFVCSNIAFCEGHIAPTNGDSIGMEGDTIAQQQTYNLNLETDDTISAIQFDIVYDNSKLEFNDIVIGQSAQDAIKMVEFAAVNSDQIRVLVYGLDKNVPDTASNKVNQNVISPGTVGIVSFNELVSDFDIPTIEKVILSHSDATKGSGSIQIVD